MPPPLSSAPTDLTVAIGGFEHYRSSGLQISGSPLHRQYVRQLISDVLTGTRFFRQVVSEGQPADLEYHERARYGAMVDYSSLRHWYQGLALLPALVLPVPLPLGLDLHSTIWFETELEGRRYIVRTYEGRSTLQFWSLGIWPPIIASKRLDRQYGVPYATAILSRTLSEDEAFWRWYGEKRRTGDITVLRTMLIEKTETPSRVDRSKPSA